MSRNRTAQASPLQRPRWKSVDQLSDIWGLSRARTRLVLRALVQTGRMEERDGEPARITAHEYRVVHR